MENTILPAELPNVEASTKMIQREIAELGPWFHNLHLSGGIETFPDHFLGDFPTFKWQEISSLIPDDLKGWSALDIGCNAGYYSFKLAERGARVVGIDHDPHYLKQAEWAARQYGVQNQVEFRCLQVYELAALTDAFDIVLFMGVLYHLRYPLLGLDIVAQKVRKLMVFQTLMLPGGDVYEYTEDGYINERRAMLEPGWPKLAFIENRFAGDPTNWWIPNHAGVEAMLRSSGMRIVSRPAHEVYVCEPNPDAPSCITSWNSAEFLAATGCTQHQSG